MADHFLVIAWTDQEKKKNRDHSGLSAFIVERAFKGFSSYTIKEKWGILAGNTGGFSMQDVEVPVENRVGGGGRRLQGRHVRPRERPLHGGGGGHRPHPRLPRRLRAATRRTARPSGSPIGEHQLVKEMIAEMVSDYDAARLLWLRAGWLKNEGRRNTRETSARQVVRDRQERAGGLRLRADPRRATAISDEYPAGRFFRNSKAAVIYEGTREIHKIMQADYALGYRQDKPRRVELPAYNE